MSLRVWLPLNGDLHNQGCTNITVINNGATVNTNGKIGSCYYFNASSYLYENTYNWTNFNTSQFSLCCWYKQPSPVASGNSQIICIGTSSGWNNIRIGLLRRASNGYPMFSVSDGSSAVSYNCTATTFSLDTWNHIACTYDNGTIKIYLNGTLNKTYTTTIAPVLNSSQHLGIGAASNGAEKLTGYLNDVRVYDHALSAAEVKEISQGLVLHYKLDNTCAFTDLIARNVNVTAYNNHGNTNNPTTITYLSTHYYGDRIIQYSATPTENAISSIQSSLSSHGIYNWHQTFKANTKYVFWIYYKPISHPDTRCGGTASNIGGWTEISPVEVGDGWYRVGQYRNGTVTSDKSDNIFVSYKTPSAQVGDTIIIQFAAPHLIEGMMEIPPYDYSFDVIEDSSGYNHNGTLAGAAVVTSETPRYNVSTHFSANNQYIHVSDLTTSGFGSTYTFAWWEKRATYSNTMAWGFQNGIRLNGLYNGNLWNTGDSSNNPLYKPGTTTAVTVPTVNVWHHFAMVADGSTCKVYQDGELWAQAKTFKQISGTNLYINGWDSGTSYKSTDMSISDFRLYATPLLDTDIKQLYNVGMKVDKSQNVHAFEFNEQNENLFSSIPWTTTFGTHSKTNNLFTNFNSNGEPQFTANSTSAGSDYIIITPGIYEYDYTISVNTGNQFYIGFERYDADKTSRSNAATVYTYSTKPTTNIVKQRYKGTVNLSTDGVNPIKYIALRILNGWSGTTSGVVGQATIHNFSLKLQSTAIDPSLNKQGRLLGGEYKEYSKASLYKDHIIEASQIIEK